jgi:hypothetical protein
VPPTGTCGCVDNLTSTSLGSVDNPLMDELAPDRPLDQKIIQSLNPVDRLLWRRVISRQVAAGPDSFLCRTAKGYGPGYATHTLVARMWLLQASFLLLFMIIAFVVSRGATTVESITFLVLGLSACVIGLVHVMVGISQKQV